METTFNCNQGSSTGSKREGEKARLLTFFTVCSSPARVTLTDSGHTDPVTVTVRHLALVMTDLALLSLPVRGAVTPPAPVVPVPTAEDGAEAGLAGIARPLRFALTQPGHTAPVTSAVSALRPGDGAGDGDQAKLHLSVGVVVYSEVPAALLQHGRDGLGLGDEPPGLTEDVLHPVVLGHTGVLQVSPEDGQGLAALYDGDVEGVERLPGDGQLGEPQLAGSQPGLDPLVGHQPGLGAAGGGRVRPVIILAGLFLLRDAVVGQIVQAGGVNHRVGQRRRLRGWEPHGSEVDNDGGEEEREDRQADGHHLPAAVEETAGPREGILLSENIHQVR